jgi:glyoxylase-like metal-dependent hydrolase (beta-lactamase superfamily II)
VEIFPHIYQLKVPIPDNPLGHLNAYLIRDGDEGHLIDCGWNAPEAWDALRQQLDAAGVGLRGLRTIVMTHIHPDHYGLAGRLKESSGARLILHRLEEPFIESRYVRYERVLDELGPWLRQFGVPDAELTGLQRASMAVLPRVAVGEPDELLFGGETLALGPYTFEVYWTPGHSPGHICLYERSAQVLIAGDHILETITPNVSYNPQSGPNPMRDYIDALQRIRDLPTKLILPGHERPMHDLPKRIAEIIAHHEERNQDILKALNAGALVPYDIARAIPWIGGTVTWEDLSVWHRRLAVMETLSHLEYMRWQGRVKRTTVDGLVRYQRI